MSNFPGTICLVGKLIPEKKDVEKGAITKHHGYRHHTKTAGNEKHLSFVHHILPFINLMNIQNNIITKLSGLYSGFKC